LNKTDLKSLELHELKELFLELGEKPFRGEQTFKWIHKNLIKSIHDITVLSKSLKDKLNGIYTITNLKILERYDSKIDDTKKYLFMLEDGNVIESVMMKYKHGVSVCLSTQVGCRMGCSFCASTKSGLVRNLSAGEILDQFYSIQKDIDMKISNIVLMGSGEPLDNFSNVMKFFHIIHDNNGQNLSYRNITISTCGIVPKIYDLADAGIPLNLSISLHSPFDDERRKIMPIANKYSISEIIDACRYYIDKTSRRVTFEYTLIKDVNDRTIDAQELIKLLKGMLCHINLIPLNPINEFSKTKSIEKNIRIFKETLLHNGINTTIRREMGGDVNAACGQLRRKYIENISNE
jgi:23S rRNA (adenine2503-C2)-methyltransferase